MPIFWRAYIHFSLVRADLNSVLRANFGAYKLEPETSFITECLGCAECECFAGAVSHCNFTLCVATKLAWVGACIPPGLYNTTCVAWEQGGYAVQPIMLYLVLFMCLLLSPPSSHRKTARVSTAAALPSTATSTAHPSSQPRPQLPSYQAQLKTTGKCETESV